MASKYDRLREFLLTAPDEEPVSVTFAEMDQLVDGLPASARTHRTWWGNTFSHNRPHALAWMTTGRRVIELRMAAAVVFSPADAPIEPSPATTAPGVTTAGKTAKTGLKGGGGKPPVLLDGVDSLKRMLQRAGYTSVVSCPTPSRRHAP